MNCSCSKSSKVTRLVVISGPSGSGKTTVCNRLLEDKNIMLGVSATTRSPRPGEQDGVDYYFLDRDEFRRRIERGDFAEYAEYNGNLYGTPKAKLEESLRSCKTVLIEIDVQGAQQLRRMYPNGLFIFLDTPGNHVARERLDKRGTESLEEKEKRIANAERERAAAESSFDHRVINDDLNQTVEHIRKLIAGITG